MGWNNKVVNGYTITQSKREEVFHKCSVYNLVNGSTFLVKVGVPEGEVQSFCESMSQGNYPLKTSKNTSGLASENSSKSQSPASQSPVVNSVTTASESTEESIVVGECLLDSSLSTNVEALKQVERLNNMLRKRRPSAIKKSDLSNNVLDFVTNTLQRLYGINLEEAKSRDYVSLGYNIINIFDDNEYQSYLPYLNKRSTFINNQIVHLGLYRGSVLRVSLDDTESPLSTSVDDNYYYDFNLELIGDKKYHITFETVPDTLARKDWLYGEEYTKFAPEEIIVYDIETTGVRPETDEILQCTIIDGSGKILFNKFCKPLLVEDWADAAAVNGIYPEDVKNEKPFEEYIPEVQKLLDKAKLVVGFNQVHFDNKSLTGKYKLHFRPDSKQYDVMQEYMKVVNFVSAYRQEGLKLDMIKLTTAYIDLFGITDEAENLILNAHASDVDCQMTLQIFKELVHNPQLHRNGYAPLSRWITLYHRSARREINNARKESKNFSKSALDMLRNGCHKLLFTRGSDNKFDVNISHTEMYNYTFLSEVSHSSTLNMLGGLRGGIPCKDAMIPNGTFKVDI